MKFNESHIEAMYKYFIFYEYNYIYRNKKYDPKDPNSGGKYFNAINPHTKKPFKLTKKQIENHLAGKDTIGVRAKNYTKFMCLDIDTKGDQAKQDARNLISLLQVEFNISIEHIHLVNSANKGYHIFLFFDDIVSVSNMEKFYIDILNKSQYSTRDIELRPTTMAVKLPMVLILVQIKYLTFVTLEHYE
ncbi:DNA primase small subunit domain-containing protein [Staphylococcus xylosus]|uniref:TOTE conflict system archaeo-eukaryotic primase domain-containing protein n=1 Tax=Staphylococcus xylosus TaxID=1288 RepID=UPI00398AB7B3